MQQTVCRLWLSPRPTGWAVFRGPTSKRSRHASTPPLSFLQAGCPSCRPTNSVKAPKAKMLYYWANKMTTIMFWAIPPTVCRWLQNRASPAAAAAAAVQLLTGRLMAMMMMKMTADRSRVFVEWRRQHHVLRIGLKSRQLDHSSMLTLLPVNAWTNE